MLFRQLFDKSSSTYTYLIASAKGREALIIDPVLENVERYIQLLKELDFKISKSNRYTHTCRSYLGDCRTKRSNKLCNNYG